MRAPIYRAVFALLLAVALIQVWLGRPTTLAPFSGTGTNDLGTAASPSIEPRRGPGVRAFQTGDSASPLDRTPTNDTTPPVRAGEWSILVVDPSGRALADARVDLVEIRPANEESGSRPAKSVLGSARSDEDGLARFAAPANAERVGVVADADGWLRGALAPPIALVDEPSRPLTIVLRPGGQLRGRVVDARGQPVPGLGLVAVTAGYGIDHVSLSSRELRALDRFQDPRLPDYQQSRAESADDGAVVFDGVPARAELDVRSDDPAWRIAEPRTVQGDAPFVTWVAVPVLGVVVRVLDSLGRRPVPASAKFRVDLDLGDGSRRDIGQWVGKGQGSLRFSFHEELFPGLAELDVVRATFHGTVTTPAGTSEWRATPILDPVRGGVAEVELLVPASALSGPSTPSGNPTLPLILDVRGGDGQPFAGSLVLRWSSATRAGNPRGDLRPEMTSPGLFRAEVPLPGDVAEIELAVEQVNASGSVPPWVRSVPATPDRVQTLSLELPPSGSVVILRPARWTSAWSVRASYREAPTETWQGSWTYGTREDRLELNALRPAEWRFELTQDSPARTDTLTVPVRPGEQRFVGG